MSRMGREQHEWSMKGRIVRDQLWVYEPTCGEGE